VGELTKPQKAKLHALAGKLGLDEESYRGALKAAGVESGSSNDMTQRQYNTQLEWWGEAPPTVPSDGWRDRVGGAPKVKRRQISKIAAICREMSLPPHYVDGMARRMFGVTHTSFCTPDQLWRITAALAKHQKRWHEKEEEKK